MNYYINEYLERVAEIGGHLKALSALYGDFKTLNTYRGQERQAIRTIIDDLTAEQAELKLALQEGRIIKRAVA